ncbi:hypothetical protein HDU97_002832 [Phlyctochytrium planicorne]|nr:hypothetical protein HDU97_002832 [Phlyctochytrium planicorne]
MEAQQQPGSSRPHPSSGELDVRLLETKESKDGIQQVEMTIESSSFPSMLAHPQGYVVHHGPTTPPNGLYLQHIQAFTTPAPYQGSFQPIPQPTPTPFIACQPPYHQAFGQSHPSPHPQLINATIHPQTGVLIPACCAHAHAHHHQQFVMGYNPHEIPAGSIAGPPVAASLHQLATVSSLGQPIDTNGSSLYPSSLDNISDGSAMLQHWLNATSTVRVPAAGVTKETTMADTFPGSITAFHGQSYQASAPFPSQSLTNISPPTESIAGLNTLGSVTLDSFKQQTSIASTQGWAHDTLHIKSAELATISPLPSESMHIHSHGSPSTSVSGGSPPTSIHEFSFQLNANARGHMPFITTASTPPAVTVTTTDPFSAPFLAGLSTLTPPASEPSSTPPIPPKSDIHPSVLIQSVKPVVDSKSSKPRQRASALSPYVCPYPGCNRTFTRRSHLASHAVSHSSRKDFVCQKCGSAFARSHDLQRHKKTANCGTSRGGSPKDGSSDDGTYVEAPVFACPNCGVTCKRKDSLTKHMQHHCKKRKLEG